MSNNSPTSGNTTKKIVQPHPKVMLIDMGVSVKYGLEQAGYSTSSGTFGDIYIAVEGREVVSTITGHIFPHDIQEAEVIFINLHTKNYQDLPNGTPPGTEPCYGLPKDDLFDTRPYVMGDNQHQFDELLERGAIFIIFADAKKEYDYYSKDKIKVFGLQKTELDYEEALTFSTWSFLKILHTYIITNGTHGNKVIPVKDTIFTTLLNEHIDGDTSYLCGIEFEEPAAEILNWKPIATSKYGVPIGGYMGPFNKDKKRGWVIILPQLDDQKLLATKMLEQVLPQLAPELFPHLEGSSWLNKSEYLLPKIIELQEHIKVVEEKAVQEIAKTQAEIDVVKQSNSHLFELLTTRDDQLVAAVKKTLETLGFQQVIDMDEEGKTKPTSNARKREDLQIRDSSPLLLVEVKGLTNPPKEEDALAVQKYIAPRMRELQRFDIQGLFIVNHQRNVEPLARDNKNLFQEDILQNAQEQKFGLLTTWDLFRLARNFLQNDWQHHQIKDIFYRTGRIEPIPAHYQFIGTIERFAETISVIGVSLQSSLSVGDFIAFEVGVNFIEQEVTSIEVKKAVPVEAVDPSNVSGDLVGLKTILKKGQARQGVRVFKILSLSTEVQ